MKRQMITERLGQLAIVIALSLTTAGTVNAAPLQEVTDLRQLAREMQQKKLPLLLAFEAEHCGYCQRLKAEHLQPMNNNDDYAERVIIRTVQIDSNQTITGYDGKTISGAQLSKDYQAYLTPTMLFLDENGEEVADRMLGYNTPDYFGYYLDQAIDSAKEKMQ